MRIATFRGVGTILLGGVLAVVIGVGGCRKGDNGGPVTPPPIAVPEAQVGWMSVDEYGNLYFKNEPEPGAVRAFQLATWKEGVVAKLHATDTYFGVSLQETKVTDAGLKELAALKNLTVIDLFAADLTDAGLKELAALKNLTALNLGVTHVTDAGLKELIPLKNLTHLNLRGTRVTDAGLKELALLKNLSALSLVSTEVTDAGLKELAALKNLTFLSLFDTKVTDAGLNELVPLKNLTALEVPKVTDKALQTLREIGLLHALTNAKTADGARPTTPDQVTFVELIGSRVTDAGLKELTALKNLTSLNLNSTNVTNEGVAELQKALPNCKITR